MDKESIKTTVWGCLGVFAAAILQAKDFLGDAMTPLFGYSLLFISGASLSISFLYGLIHFGFIHNRTKLYGQILIGFICGAIFMVGGYLLREDRIIETRESPKITGRIFKILLSENNKGKWLVTIFSEWNNSGARDGTVSYGPLSLLYPKESERFHEIGLNKTVRVGSYATINDTSAAYFPDFLAIYDLCGCEMPKMKDGILSYSYQPDTSIHNYRFNDSMYLAFYLENLAPGDRGYDSSSYKIRNEWLDSMERVVNHKGWKEYFVDFKGKSFKNYYHPSTMDEISHVIRGDTLRVKWHGKMEDVERFFFQKNPRLLLKLVMGDSMRIEYTINVRGKNKTRDTPIQIPMTNIRKTIAYIWKDQFDYEGF